MSDGHDTSEARRLLAAFVQAHSASILNALNNQSRRMAEAADLAEWQGRPHYAKAFREESDASGEVSAELNDLLERVAGAQQEDNASQD